MRLSEIIQGLPVRLSDPRAGEAEVVSMTEDSREVRPGSLFIARRGTRVDGGAFLADAARAGAVAALVGPGVSAPAGLAAAQTEDVEAIGARMAERFFGSPSSSLLVVGATGTNGKTTTCFLARRLIEASGLSCGLISTVRIDAGTGPERALAKATMTTPGAIEVSSRLASMVERGCRAAVVETSSHALHQRRVAGLRYRVGVFTNLTGDHLDYHRTMEAYGAAKAMLFESLPADGWAIVNADDPWSERMLRDCPARIALCTLGAPMLRLRNATNFGASIVGASAAGQTLELKGPWGALRATTPIIGRHNAMNALQSAAVAWALGAEPKAIELGLAGAEAPPGRLQPVRRRASEPEPISVYVDYAHTDDALERALAAVRETVPRGKRLWVVFGCGGDRDRTKRPRMGRAAGALADRIVVTSDNPRTERPEAIVEEVLAGVEPSARGRTTAEVDRERAIRAAIGDAAEGDVVLIAGKGHEDYQILPDGRGGTVRRHFDDVEAARGALIERFGGAPAAAGAGERSA